MKFTIVPWALDKVWRHYATHPIGLMPTALPPQGTDRATALDIEHRFATEATAA